MIGIIQGLVRAYESLVPPPEPLCRHGFGVRLCGLCPETLPAPPSRDRQLKLEVGRPAPAAGRGHWSGGQTACSHRPGGEAAARWFEAVGGPDTSVCSCCGGSAPSDLGSGLLCPVCRLGWPHLAGSGHLVRLALDLGARPAERVAGTELREVADPGVGNSLVLAGTVSG